MTDTKKTPPYPLEALAFVPITTDEKFEQIWAENHPEWGSMFAREAWIQAAKERASLEYSTNGRFKTFMVTPKNDPSQPIIGCCGIYERPTIVATKKAVTNKDSKSSSVETRVQDVLAATACSVFSPVQYRGYGYGAWMMSQLWRYLEKSPVQFTFLYSDVGLFYDRFGWKKHRSECIELTTDNTTPPLVPPTAGEACPEWEPITDNNLHEILDRDASLLRDELTAQIEDSPEGTTLFAVVPEPRSDGWHRSRENFFLRHLKQDPSLRIDRYGVFLSAQCSPSGSSLNTLRYITWFHEFRREELIVMRFRHGLDKDHPEAKQEALLLLQQAVEEAKRWQLKKVIIWNPHPILCEWTKLQAQERSKGFSCLGVCQGPSVDEQHSAPISHIEWVMNEYYSWC